MQLSRFEHRRVPLLGPYQRQQTHETVKAPCFAGTHQILGVCELRYSAQKWYLPSWSCQTLKSAVQALVPGFFQVTATQSLPDRPAAVSARFHELGAGTATQGVLSGSLFHWLAGPWNKEPTETEQKYRNEYNQPFLSPPRCSFFCVFFLILCSWLLSV